MKCIFIIFFLYILPNVSSQDCAPSNITLEGFKKNPRRSVPFIVEATANKCPGQDEFHYKWTLTKLPEENLLGISVDSNIEITGYNFDPSETFTSTYVLNVTISHFSNMTNSTTESREFTFIPDEMHIEIVGGVFRRHYYSENLTLDALTLSKDTSYAPEEDPFEGNEAFWSMSPSMKNIPLEGIVIVIPGGVLNFPVTYNFTVNVTRTKIPGFVDTKLVSQLVYVIRRRDPDFSVKCIRNCKNANPYETTTLIAVCKKNCQNIKYEWSLTPNISNFYIDFGTGHKKIVINAGAYLLSDEVEVKATSSGISKTYTIKFVDNMKQGKCQINPKTGISGITLFKITCTGFRNESEPLDYMIFQKSSHAEGGILISTKSSHFEQKMYLAKGNPTLLIIVAQDKYYIQGDFFIRLTVHPLTGDADDVVKLKAIKRLILGEDKDCLKYLSFNNKTNYVVQKSSILLDELNEIPTVDDSLKKFLHKHICLALKKVEPYDFESAIQTLSIVIKLNELKVKSDSLITRMVSEMVRQSVVAVHRVVRFKLSKVPFLYLSNFIRNILNLLGDFIESKKDIQNILDNYVPAHDYDSYDEMVSEKVKIWYDYTEIVNNVLITLKILGACIIYLNVPGQKEVSYDERLITFVTKRIKPFHLYTHIIGLPNRGGSYVRFSRYFAESLTLKYDFVDYQYASFRENIFWWHRKSSDINTELLLFDLVRQFEDVTTVENTYQINLNTKSVPLGNLSGSIEDNQRLHVYKFDVKEVNLLLFEFKNIMESYYVTYSDCYCSDDDFKRGIEVRPNGSEENHTLNVIPSRSKDYVYLCIKKKYSYSKVPYEASFSSFTCVHWDLIKGQWDHNKCEVQRARLENDSHLKCLCNHASLFAGKIFVPPNTLNVSFDIDINVLLLKNWVMVLIIATILALWVLISCLGFKTDKKFKKRNFICILDDNIPGDEHVYVMVIFTGVFIDAGTSADVAFQVFGSMSNSRVHLIKCANVKLLKRNAQDWIIFYTPEELGDIHKMRIWHNCKGINPHWYCSRIIIQHLKSGTQYCFEIQKWFSLIWDGGQIYRKVFPQKEDKYKSTKFLMMIKLRTQIKEKHLWVSILARDPQSNFKSIERVACAFAFLFLSMLVSAMFYGLPKGIPADFIEEKESLKHFRFQLMIIIESFLISFPISFIILTIFQHSSPPDNYEDDDDDDDDDLLKYETADKKS